MSNFDPFNHIHKKEMPCLACGGKGTYLGSPVCPECNGEKFLRTFNPDPNASVSSLWKMCRKCNGQGILPSITYSCPHCQGTGKIERNETR